jgi:RNA polymerase sigma factor (sigma-70 family)
MSDDAFPSLRPSDRGRGPPQRPTVAGAVSDARLIAVSNNEPERFAAIFDRHYDVIYAYLRRRLARAEAEDLAAETFLVAFRERGRYDLSHTSSRPWLFGIAANLARRRARQERRQLRAYARSGIDPAREEVDEVESRMDSVAARPKLAYLLASLSTEEREVLSLYAWAGLSYDEIASSLQIPVGTVRSRLSRARGKARELLSREGAITD